MIPAPCEATVRVPPPCEATVRVPPPAYHRTQAKRRPALHLDALTVVRRLHLLALCRLVVRRAHRRCPPICGWSAVTSRVALTYAATVVVALAAHQAARPDLTRSPKRVLAHTWESLLE